QRVGATSARLAKVRELATLLAALEPDEIAIAALYLAGETPQGRIGIGYRALQAAAAVGPAAGGTVSIADVDRRLAALAATRGAGSAARRAALLRGLFALSTQDEQSFLLHLLAGELRQGALAGIMADAIAATARVPEAEVRPPARYPGNPAEALILDGEAIAFDSSGRPHPFQTTMRRFGRRLDVEAVRAALPLRAFFFDCLRLEAQSIADRASRERFEALARAVPEGSRIR